jgi:hypothetical protein
MQTIDETDAEASCLDKVINGKFVYFDLKIKEVICSSVIH